MAIQYFAKVTASDHEVLQRIVKHYPLSSYADWHLKEMSRMSDWRSRRHAIKMVPVTPQEFEEYCKLKGVPSDIITFKAFVCEKGGG